MMLFSEIKRIFKCTNINISERLNTAEASFSIFFKDLPSMQDFNYICSLVSKRDSLKITLKNDSGEIITISNKKTDNWDFSALIDDLLLEDEVYISIQIDKNDLNEKFSIYDFDSFTSNLLQRPTTEVMKWFSERLQHKDFLLFEVYDYDISFSTRTIAFESSDIATFNPKVDRNKRINSCKENSCFYNMDSFEIIPDDFIIEGVVRAGEQLKPLFGKLSTILSLLYIVSSSSIYDDKMNLQINGQRTTNQIIALDDVREDNKWVSLYTWIFTDGNSTDKILIAHNVMSLYCKYDNFFNTDVTMFEAIKTNYNLYLRKHVGEYINLKHEIAKIIHNFISQVSDYTLSMLGKFKANLIAIFGFLFTVVLTKIGATQKWTDIFTKDTIYIIEFFVVGSIVYMLICFFEMKYKLEKVRLGYEELKNNYRDILSNLEIKEAFQEDKPFDAATSSAKKGMVRWTIVWGILLITCVLIIEIFTTNHGLIVWLWNKLSSNFYLI